MNYYFGKRNSRLDLFNASEIVSYMTFKQRAPWYDKFWCVVSLFVNMYRWKESWDWLQGIERLLSLVIYSFLVPLLGRHRWAVGGGAWSARPPARPPTSLHPLNILSPTLSTIQRLSRMQIELSLVGSGW